MKTIREPDEYEFHSFKLRWMEFTRMAHPYSFRAFLLWPIAQLGLVRWSPIVFPRTATVQDFEIEFDQIPEFAQENCKKTIQDIGEHRAKEIFVEANDATGVTDEQINGVCLWVLSESGTELISATISRTGTVKPLAVTSIVSMIGRDRFIATCNGRRRLEPMDYIESVYRLDAPMEELLELHFQRIKKQGQVPIVLSGRSEFIGTIDRLSDLYYETMIQRGVIRPRAKNAKPIHQSTGEDGNPYRPPVTPAD